MKKFESFSYFFFVGVVGFSFVVVEIKPRAFCVLENALLTLSFSSSAIISSEYILYL